MIVITRTSNSMTICGHANYAPRGQDIVCAAVSALWQTLIASLDELADYHAEYEEWPLQIEFNFENLTENAQLLIDSFFIGANGIAAAYPDYVTVTDRRGLSEHL